MFVKGLYMTMHISTTPAVELAAYLAKDIARQFEEDHSENR